MSFQHAPVSKGLMLGYAATSIAVGIFDLKHYFHVQLVPHISLHHQYWRLFVHQLAIGNSSDLLLTEILLYNASVPIERLFGSAKFASFAIVTTLTAVVLNFLALIIFSRMGLNVLPSGPITLVFGILYQFSRLVPSTYSFRVFGLLVTNKVFVYILAWQLGINEPPGSVVLLLIGLLVGQLYRSDAIGLKTYRLPAAVYVFASRFLLPLLGAERPARRSNQALPEGVSESAPSPLTAEEATTPASSASETPSRQTESDRVGAGGSALHPFEWLEEFAGRRERTATAGNLRAPSQAEIEQMTNMFPNIRREDIVGALQLSTNVESAVETLLTLQR